MIVRSLFVTAAALALIGSGCRKAAVESYRIPKEKDPEMPIAAAPAGAGGAPASAEAATAPGAGSMAATPVATADGAGLTWTGPAEWTAQPASGMRKGSFTVPGTGGMDATLAITAFPGDVGGELANVNRWRGQIQLPAVASLEGQVQRFEANGLRFGIVDVVGTGEKPTRILGAYVPYGGATWFFKLMGPDATVSAAKPAFLKFLETVKPAARQP